MDSSLSMFSTTLKKPEKNPVFNQFLNPHKKVEIIHISIEKVLESGVPLTIIYRGILRKNV